MLSLILLALAAFIARPMDSVATLVVTQLAPDTDIAYVTLRVAITTMDSSALARVKIWALVKDIRVINCSPKAPFCLERLKCLGLVTRSVEWTFVALI